MRLPVDPGERVGRAVEGGGIGGSGRHSGSSRVQDGGGGAGWVVAEDGGGERAALGEQLLLLGGLAEVRGELKWDHDVVE